MVGGRQRVGIPFAIARSCNVQFGAYGGCIGFIGLHGGLNQAITIRTFVSRNHELWFQAGGGITALSSEDNELQEVNNKLGALKKAIVMAEKM